MSPYIPEAITSSPASPRRGGAAGAGAGAGAGVRTLPPLGAPRDFQSCVPCWGWGAARGARRRRQRRGERCGGRIKAPPSSGGPGQVRDRPFRSRGLGRASLGRRPGALLALSATGPSRIRGQRELGQELRAEGRKCWGWPGGGAPAAGRLHGSQSCCCSAALTVDWFYSPGIKPALLSSRRQPPRGKPTLPRPLRLPSPGPAPAPRAGPRGALPP